MSQDSAPENPTAPYQPYQDAIPPENAPISSANGTLISPDERDKELLQDSTRADRAATPEPDEAHIEFPPGLPTPPFIHVEGIPNFRDLGGYQCQPPPSASSSDGKVYQLRKGILYRCAHPTHLTPQGLETLTQRLGVTTLFDLRSQPEITRLAGNVATSPKSLYPLADPSTGTIGSHPSTPGLTRRFTPVYQTEDYGPVALARKLQWYTATHDAQHSTLGFSYSEGFVHAYRDIAAHGASAYASIFQHILEHGEASPLAFHCAAGKDRTGVFGALIMRLVGVDEDTICWEYALTEPGLGRWREQFIQRISRSGLGGGGSKLSSEEKTPSDKNAVSREEAARICGSRAGNMRAWLDTVLDGEFGGVDRYLTEKCGLTTEQIDRLRTILSVPVPDGHEVTRRSEIAGWTPEGGVQD
ncbi:hypothetical protein B0A52_05045 [Exophiala mesophila]|uniref:Tyrosine specific protein phosphatases domain-containing protein n=1 Tax=Exophiala mesophila TaxID=212818 RepID=A0A438N7D5_EXOME|nr:hypothetical protein B0A52_05045 [Exophiala mesophila]